MVIFWIFVGYWNLINIKWSGDIAWDDGRVMKTDTAFLPQLLEDGSCSDVLPLGSPSIPY